MTAPTAPSHFYLRLLIGGLGFLFFLIFLAIFVAVFGNVAGEEFSPQSFSIRKFSYQRLPFARVRISSTKLDSPIGTLICPTDISKHLTAGIGTPSAMRWDLSEHSIGSQPIDGEATILVKFLRDPFWDTWSVGNPKKAQVLWPAIQDLAIHHCYFAVPTALFAAENAETPGDLKKELDRITLEAAEKTATHFYHIGRKTEGSEIASWGLSFGNSALLQPLASEKASSPTTPSEAQAEITQ